LCALLASGKNVVTTVGYVHPRSYGEDVHARLRAACTAGHTSLHGTGLNPGFQAEIVPLVLSGWCRRIDRVLVRDSERNNGNGPLIRLADAFQCGDRVTLPDTQAARADHGLPDTGIVFCAFGNWLKIDEAVFACWLDILSQTPDSVLWLSDGPSATSRDILRGRLSERELAPERLVFAPRLASKMDHLNRHQCADLFLDTFTFSAATTTTDALWAGLPVLTCPGSTAQSRLSESLLRAVGLTQTIVANKKDYVHTAIRWAKEPQTLVRLRTQLKSILPDSKLYDARRMALQFAIIYQKVSERLAKGQAPEHFDVEL
jgi:predicted O-linked N-acetylglucosamine transferase (SPINDLY family)